MYGNKFPHTRKMIICVINAQIKKALQQINCCPVNLSPFLFGNESKSFLAVCSSELFAQVSHSQSQRNMILRGSFSAFIFIYLPCSYYVLNTTKYC